MRKFQAINHYLTNYNQIYTEIVNAIMGSKCPQDESFNIEIQTEKDNLALFLKKFRNRKS
jgi:hypothetical protein